MGLADWILTPGQKGETFALDRRAWSTVRGLPIAVPRVKLVLGKGQRRNRRRHLARTAPFVPFTLGWAGNLCTRSPNFSTEVLFTR